MCGIRTYGGCFGWVFRVVGSLGALAWDFSHFFVMLFFVILFLRAYLPTNTIIHIIDIELNEESNESS